MQNFYPAITIWQPWASLIAIGAKPFEFRAWAAPRVYWNKRVAVHAGARKVNVVEVRALLVRLHSEAWRETGLHRDEAIAFLETVKRAPKDLPLKSVVCLATLGIPVTGNAMAERLGLPAVNDSDRDQHLSYGWPLTEVARLEPFVPAIGSQGWWRWKPTEAFTPVAG